MVRVIAGLAGNGHAALCTEPLHHTFVLALRRCVAGPGYAPDRGLRCLQHSLRSKPPCRGMHRPPVCPSARAR